MGTEVFEVYVDCLVDLACWLQQLCILLLFVNGMNWIQQKTLKH